MSGQGKSDDSVVPEKRSNKGGGAPPPAESVEERGSAKGNSQRQSSLRAQNRARLQRELARVRQLAQRDEEVRRITPPVSVGAPARPT